MDSSTSGWFRRYTVPIGAMYQHTKQSPSGIAHRGSQSRAHRRGGRRSSDNCMRRHSPPTYTKNFHHSNLSPDLIGAMSARNCKHNTNRRSPPRGSRRPGAEEETHGRNDAQLLRPWGRLALTMFGPYPHVELPDDWESRTLTEEEKEEVRHCAEAARQFGVCLPRQADPTSTRPSVTATLTQLCFIELPRNGYSWWPRHGTALRTCALQLTRDLSKDSTHAARRAACKSPRALRKARRCWSFAVAR